MQEQIFRDLEKIGSKFSKVETDLEMPKNYLSRFKNPENKLPEKWIPKLQEYIKNHPLGKSSVTPENYDSPKLPSVKDEPLQYTEPRTQMVIEKEGLKIKPSKEISSKLAEVMAKINKDYGAGTVMMLGERSNNNVEVVPTGSLGLDLALGVGGLPRGRIVEIYGPESCLEAATFVQYEIRTKDGKRQNHKGGTIKRLFQRFNKIQISGQGYYNRPISEESEYFMPCMNEEGRIFQNKVEKVVATGHKECFVITTLKGYEICATAEHKFFDGNKYASLSSLMIGDILMVHNNTPFKKDHITYSRRKETRVKNHPTAPIKILEGRYIYNRIVESRLIMEASLNNLSKEEYIKKLNSGDTKGLKTLDRNDHVHHVDEDTSNNNLSNLVLISASDHGKLHAIQRHNNLRFTVVPDEIVSIESVGIKETYDIRMQSPFNNYVANKFVVHNSGKTTLAIHVIAQAQKMGLKCMMVDAEHAFDPEYAENLGVNIDELIICQPSYGEQGLEVADRNICSGEIGLVVIDSVAALTPKAEIEGEMGDSKMGLHARLMSQACRKMAASINNTNCICIFINQLRSMIGVVYGNPEITTGGNALKFYASVRLDVRKKAVIKDGEESVGNRVVVKVVKNKVAPPFKTAEFDIIYGKGISKSGEILDRAAELNIVEKSGSWYAYKGSKLGQGREAVKDVLEGNSAMMDEIETLIKYKVYV